MTKRTTGKTQDRRLADIETMLRRLADGGGMEALLVARFGQMERQMEEMLTSLLVRTLAQTFNLGTGGTDLLGGLLGTVPRLADGGVVDGPSMLALGGEAGPEAVLPLTRLPDGRLGVQTQAGSSPVTINLQIGGGASFDGTMPDEAGSFSGAGGEVALAALQDAIGDALDQAVQDRLQQHLRDGGVLAAAREAG
jgi:hypothetical protein